MNSHPLSSHEAPLTLRYRRASGADANLFSRRRANRRASDQTRLPDWVWGAGIGILVLVFVGGYFVVTGVLGGGSAGPCDNALPPLGTSIVDADAFAEQDVALTRVVELLEQGDRAGAEAAFYGPVHGFTHNVDPKLREVDEGMAKELCEAVIQLENDLASRATDVEIIGGVEAVQVILRDAAEALGYPRPESAVTATSEGRSHPAGWLRPYNT